MGRRVLRRHIWGYSVCLCPIKRTQGLYGLKFQTLNQICTDPQVREVLTKIQNHIDVLEKSTARVSSRAEVLGAIQQVWEGMKFQVKTHSAVGFFMKQKTI